MPALGYKRRFAKLVYEGKKLHTIRAKRKNPIKAGDRLFHFVDMRQPTCMKFGESDCEKVEEITVVTNPTLMVTIGTRALSWGEIQSLSSADGFANTNDFFQFFKRSENGIFIGDLIHWKTFEAIPGLSIPEPK